MFTACDAHLDAAEGRLLLSTKYPETVAESVKIDGLYGFRSLMTEAVAGHMVGFTRVDENSIGTTIEAVKSYYGAYGQPFVWMVNERSQPANLADYLQAAGFVRARCFHGMVFTDLHHMIKLNPKVSIHVAQKDDHCHVHRLYHDAYGMGDDDHVAAILAMRNAVNARHYLAWIEGESQPVAVGTMYYIPDQPIVTLQGAATLEAFRGKGIYSALLARRLDDARRDGMETAVAHANPETSGPILARMGFEKVLDLGLYRYPSPGG